MDAQSSRSDDRVMVALAYEFFVKMETSNQHFTLADICDATGYKEGTAESHLDKKWRWFLQSTPQGLRCEGILPCPKEDFIAGHRQVWEWKPPTSAHGNEEADSLSQKPRFDTLVFSIVILIAWATLYKHRHKWHVRIGRLSLPL